MLLCGEDFSPIWSRRSGDTNLANMVSASPVEDRGGKKLSHISPSRELGADRYRRRPLLICCCCWFWPRSDSSFPCLIDAAGILRFRSLEFAGDPYIIPFSRLKFSIPTLRSLRFLPPTVIPPRVSSLQSATEQRESSSSQPPAPAPQIYLRERSQGRREALILRRRRLPHHRHRRRS